MSTKIPPPQESFPQLRIVQRKHKSYIRRTFVARTNSFFQESSMSSSPIWMCKFIAAHDNGFSLRPEGMNQGVHVVTTPPSCKMGVDSRFPLKESLEDIPVCVLGPSIPQNSDLRLPDLQFDQLQQQSEDPEALHGGMYEFEKFVVREAVLDEELWTAAWLRAESHWEEQECDRYADNHKRKFAEQEFNALKRRCKGQYGPPCMCIVTVRKDQDYVKQSVLRSVVGTLDLSIRCLLHEETFPGERVRPPFFCHIDGTGCGSSYGYIANLCVAKSARRQGIATNMTQFTLELAKASGVEKVYAHVHRHNRHAREFYSKLGFEIIEEATAQLAEEQQYLLCLDI